MNGPEDQPAAATVPLITRDSEHEEPDQSAKVDRIRQERLINWGYAVTDAAMRKHVDPALTPAGDFPYPAASVGQES